MSPKALKAKVKKYFELENEIFAYFGYREDWVKIPLEENLNYYWFVTGEKNSSNHCAYSPEPFTEESIRSGSAIYSGTIFTQRFLPKWVYRGQDFTMVSVDTHFDNNKFLMLFDNSKECKDESLIKLFERCWND